MAFSLIGSAGFLPVRWVTSQFKADHSRKPNDPFGRPLPLGQPMTVYWYPNRHSARVRKNLSMISWSRWISVHPRKMFDWWQYALTHTLGPLAKALATAAAQQCKFLIDKCWIKSARNETNKHSVHSSAGQGEPLGWSFPAWPRNSTNFRWPDAYAFLVEGAKLWAKKCRHRCSRAEVLSCPAEAEEWGKGLSEPPEPTAWTPANGNEK